MAWEDSCLVVLPSTFSTPPNKGLPHSYISQTEGIEKEVLNKLGIDSKLLANIEDFKANQPVIRSYTKDA